jgi:hypothetical protein
MEEEQGSRRKRIKRGGRREGREEEGTIGQRKARGGKKRSERRMEGDLLILPETGHLHIRLALRPTRHRHVLPRVPRRKNNRVRGGIQFSPNLDKNSETQNKTSPPTKIPADDPGARGRGARGARVARGPRGSCGKGFRGWNGR